MKMIFSCEFISFADSRLNLFYLSHEITEVLNLISKVGTLSIAVDSKLIWLFHENFINYFLQISPKEIYKVHKGITFQQIGENNLPEAHTNIAIDNNLYTSCND